MKGLFLGMVLAVAAGVPAFAMSDMSCADFMKQDQATQMKTVDAMKADSGMMASGSMMAGDDTTDPAVACERNPEMTVHDAMDAMGKM